MVGENLFLCRNNSLARDYVEPGGSRETLHGNDNTGYDPERPPESTQMVTFNSNNGQMQGIHLPDSRSQVRDKAL